MWEAARDQLACMLAAFRVGVFCVHIGGLAVLVAGHATLVS